MSPLNLNREKMPSQEPLVRARNFEEVNLGLSPEQARREAERCLLCKKPTCVTGCPVHINIPHFIQAILENHEDEAVRRIRTDNSLPAICGRVCPQETQCEEACVLNKKGAPVAIGALERYVGDYAIRACVLPDMSRVVSQNKKIAVVGSGPSGLTCAGELVKLGYQVTVFEALHELGGVLAYGIPEFRLPKEMIVRCEIDTLRHMGVEFITNAVIGKLNTVPELLAAGFAAVYVATGAGYPSFMNIPGEDLNYVYSANEFLTRVNLMQAFKGEASATPLVVGKRVAVIGGGNTALDAARSALRLGAEKVFLVYRRSEAEMPGRLEEIHHAQEEGIDFQLLTLPLEYLGKEDGSVRAMRCVRMELGEPDASGRRKPVPIADSEFEFQIDSAVVAIGTQANPIIAQTTPGLQTNPRGYIVANESGETSLPRVYAGGDIVSGAATVILAMGAGRHAAQKIHAALSGEI
ncbi:MAG: NADPH-dependent glutamate synthase [Candidatus Firestonebacteria bacterium]|nr:NADPH-dependent glutamate synthase [Candidatus Firestonebacteria bacterium]